MIKFNNWPTDSKRITSPFGPRWGGFHDGVDIGGLSPGVQGDPIYAVADGIVAISKVNNGGVTKGLGYYIVIRHDEFSTLYGHMKELGLPVNTVVKAGQIIGYMGSTGSSTAAHLHFRLANSRTISFVLATDGNTIDSLDPYKYLKESEVFDVTTPDKNIQSVSVWAEDAQKWVMTNQISDGTRPKDPVTREEVWSMIYRARNSK